MVDLSTDAAKINTARIRPYLQNRPATIKLTFRRYGFRPPLPTFAGDMYIRKVAPNGQPIRNFDFCPNRNWQIIRQIDSDVTRRGLKGGISASAGGRNELNHDSASRSFG